MTTPKADNPSHKVFWASEESDERITLIAEIAANIREDAAPEPEEQDSAYDSKSRSCELLIAEYIGTRGLVKTVIGGSGARVDFETREEAMALARQAMGRFAAEEETGGSSHTAKISTWPLSRG